MSKFDDEKPDGWKRAEDGMERVTRNADKIIRQRKEAEGEVESEPWRDRAFGAVVLWCRQFCGRVFRAEELWHWAEQERLVEEPHKRQAWGAIMRRACTGEKPLIENIGFDCARNPRGHRRPVTLWKVL